jgi:hypothetical protein
METLIVSVIALVAAAYLGRRLYISIRAARNNEPGCSSCGSCPGSAIGPAGTSDPNEDAS